MFLRLKINGEIWDSPPFVSHGRAREVLWRESPNVRLKKSTFSSDSVVSAQVIGGRKGEIFKLWHPVTRGRKYAFSDTNADGTLVAESGADEIELFHGVVGVYQFILKVDAGEGEHDCLRLPVEVETPQQSLKIVNRMIDEILNFDRLPFQLIAQKHQNIWGRISMFYAPKGRSTGEVVPWSQHESLLRLVRKLRPILTSIAEEAVTGVGEQRCFRRVSEIHRFGRYELMQLRRKGVASVFSRGAQGQKVWARERGPVFDIPANRVIRTFLMQCRSECCQLLAAIDEALADARCKGARRSVLEKRRDLMASNALPFFDRFLQGGFVWSACAAHIRLADADPSWFETSEAYRRLYSVMVEYDRAMKGRRSLVGNKHCVDYRRSPSSGPTMLQRKYDEIYEVWCYLRLVKAFIANGFSHVEEGYFNSLTADGVSHNSFLPKTVVNRPIVAMKDNIIASIYYGVEARANAGAMFHLQEGQAPLTPDYLIVFQIKGSSRKYAVIMDAKAMTGIEGEIHTRDDYLNGFNVNRYSDSHASIIRPRQSWLFYWGNGGTRLVASEAIEYAPGSGVKLEHINEGQIFPSTESQSALADLENQHVGHIKASPLTMPFPSRGNQISEDPFSWWVRIQTLFAQRYLMDSRRY